MTRQNRDAIRRTHRPVGPDQQCAVHDQVMVLREHIEELEGKIRRAIQELS